MSKNFNNKKKGSKNFEDGEWENNESYSKKPKKTRKKHWEEDEELDDEVLYFLNKIKKK